VNVTREVIMDLLPAYFSGEASGDTKELVEDYFRQDPDFERMARSGAASLETLRAARPMATRPETEKCDLESVRWGLRRRQLLFAGSVFFTLFPLSYYFTFSHGHFAWLAARAALWNAAFDWSLAVVFWFLYFAHLQRRTVSLLIAISLTLIPVPFALHSAFAGGPVVESAMIWACGAVAWIEYFKQRHC